MALRHGLTVENDPDREAAFAFAADHGFEFVELNMDHAFDRTRVDPAAVRASLAAHGLDAVVHLPYRLDIGSPLAHVREGACRELEAAIDAAAAMGAEKGVVHAKTFAHPEKWDRERVVDAVVESVQRLTAAGREAGVEVVVENLKGAYVDVFDFPALFERTDAAMCLDTGHAFVSGMDGAAQAAFLREHGDRVSHLHLNDTRVDETDEHLPVGLGKVAFEPIADAVRETGWAGTATHEVFGFDDAYVAQGKETFAAMLAR